MTTKEKIEVMQAFDDGKRIQFKAKVNNDWVDFDGDLEEPGWAWNIIEYRIKPEEQKPECRPYKNTTEMIADFYKRINRGKASYSMPLIWVKSKANGDIGLITDYSKVDGCVFASRGWTTYEQLFNYYEYLDGTPCGKLVE